MTGTKKINVVDILDPTHIILNAGTNDAIRMSDRIVLFSSNREIRDLDGRSLGFLELVKGYGRVTHVQEAFSILTSDAVGGFKANTDPMAEYINTLKGDSSATLVKKGDFARKV